MGAHGSTHDATAAGAQRQLHVNPFSTPQIVRAMMRWTAAGGDRAPVSCARITPASRVGGQGAMMVQEGVIQGLRCVGVPAGEACTGIALRLVCRWGVVQQGEDWTSSHQEVGCQGGLPWLFPERVERCAWF